MKAKVTFCIMWSEEENYHYVKILCGDVDGDGVPVPIYMAILRSMCRAEDEINGKAEPPMAAPDPQPTEDAAEAWDRQRVADLEEERNGKGGRTILPPPRRKQ